jgi:Na+-driven multidrug efflux pump
VFDPILIFGWFGLPAFGVEGAALATVGSRIIGCLVISYLLFSHHNEIRFRFRDFRFDRGVLSRIFSVGFPTMLIDLVLGITFAGTNKILDGVAMATVLIAGVGIYFRLQSIILTPVLGLSRSLIPIIGYNFGAEKYRRVWETLRLALLFSFLVSFIAFLLFELIPGQLIGVFNDDSRLVGLGSESFQRMSLLFFMVGPSMVVLTFFQGIGRATKLFIVLAVRQFLVFFPILYVLTRWYGHPTLWFAFPIADAFAIVIGGVIIYWDLRSLRLAKAIPWIKYRTS